MDGCFTFSLVNTFYGLNYCGSCLLMISKSAPAHSQLLMFSHFYMAAKCALFDSALSQQGLSFRTANAK